MFPSRCGVFAVGLLLGLIVVSSPTSQAQDESQEWDEPSFVASKYIRARIGYRKSLRDGERSTFKWLSRLIKEEPNETSFMVEWQMRRNGRTVSVLMGYDSEIVQMTRTQLFSTKPVRVNEMQALPMYSETWRPVTVQEIHSIARRNGTTAQLKILD